MHRVHLLAPAVAPPAPRWDVSAWVGDDTTLGACRDRVVVLHAFQMLCPACVSHGVPQAARIHETFSAGDVVVVGLHTVFEHHDAMTLTSLEAFLHEYRVAFPVAVDRHDPGRSIPATMRAYELRGTPSLLLIDRVGRIRGHVFGHAPDLAVGAAIATLIAERPIERMQASDGADGVPPDVH